MILASTFFERKHQNLRNDYSYEGTEFTDSCLLVALDLAKLLSGEGRIVHLDRITGRPRNMPGIIANETLLPLPYEGRIAWGAHIVCHELATDLVHDPMLPEPTKMPEYLKAVFAQEVTVGTFQLRQSAGL